MKPTMKPKRTAEQRAEEEAVRRQHAANPIRQRPAGAINRQSFTAILRLVARFKAVRESQGLTLAEVADRMGIDSPALSRLETGKMLNPTLATLHKWAEALGQKLDVGFFSACPTMPPDLALIHETIGKELRWLYAKWIEFNVLFREEATVKILNNVALLSFAIYRETLGDNLILSVCRLATDARQYTKGAQTRHNLSLKRMAACIPPSEVDLIKEVNKRIAIIMKSGKKFMAHRNRRIGHHDTLTRFGTDILPRISLFSMELMLKRIERVLNVVAKHFGGYETNYRAQAAENENGRSLLGALRMLECLREEVAKRG